MGVQVVVGFSTFQSPLKKDQKNYATCGATVRQSHGTMHLYTSKKIILLFNQLECLWKEWQL
jgi:hypothetical protein